ncbi:hypothetical protein QQB53_01410 [Niallia sp. SS-2023]|nr:hypothetical protein [Niallia sp. SS-2023]MDL0434405.1 hypothetical protein [Niallia sp. SS-2023]
MQLGQKVIYKHKIHYFFYDHGNGLWEIQDIVTKSIILVTCDAIIHRIK